ncbi:hypothetical protein M9Y10_012128 [Tritrichomonas musculus]|uniref:Uncharacterized protein n=1 Tax=Tritrichomonas musculus TaxID=1915356 RepID=A0ABR2IBQ2_9EUKA
MNTKSKLAIETLSTMKEKIIDNINNKNKQSYIPHSINITYDLVNKLFHENNCTILKTPKNIFEDSLITFYRNDNPKIILITHLSNYVSNPNKSFNKSKSKIFKQELSLEESKKIEDKLKADRSEKHRKDCEDKLRESMKNENCILQSKYVSARIPITYLYNNMQYQTTYTKWNNGYRAHQSKCPRYTHEHIAQLFEKEGCKLLSQYKNQKSRLTYEYNGKIYQVIYNDWKFYSSRPHLNQIHTYFTEELDKDLK